MTTRAQTALDRRVPKVLGGRLRWIDSQTQFSEPPAIQFSIAGGDMTPERADKLADWQLGHTPDPDNPHVQICDNGTQSPFHVSSDTKISDDDADDAVNSQLQFLGKPTNKTREV